MKMANPKANASIMIPFGATGNKPIYRNDIGYYGFTAIPAKRGQDPERVKELLRILNYLAAPFGSEEELKLAGIEGVHYTTRADGARIATPQNAEKSALPYIASPPKVIYHPLYPEDTPFEQGAIRDMLAVGQDNPTWGLYSPTEAMRRGQLLQLQNDAIIAVVTGREPLAAWDTFVKDWRSRGGDQIRKEYEGALQAH